MTALKKWSKNRYVLHELIRKKIKTQYRNSILGIFWSVLNPLLNMLVMWVVFSQFFGRNDPVYPIYLLTGSILFQSLRMATDGSLSSIVDNRGLLTKVKIDTYLFPLSSTLSALINFAFSLISLLVIMLWMQLAGGYTLYGYQILSIILMMPAFLLFEYGISLFLSAVYVFCRDIKHIYSVFLTLWTYCTPIFYQIDRIDSSSILNKILRLNPMYYFLTYFRDAMYNCSYLGMGMPSWKILGLLYLFGLISIAIGAIFYNALKKKFLLYV